MSKLRLCLIPIIPLMTGIIVGLLFPYAEKNQQEEMVSFMADFAQTGLFNILAPLAVIVFAIYVFIFGQIPKDISGKRKMLLLWLPTIALGCTLPFFIVLLGFFLTYNGVIDTTKLIVVGIVGFVYSIVFFVGMLLPAVEGFCPKDVSSKRKVYVLLLVSLGLVILWQNFT
ncbi:hypothetical protein L1D15_11240 [Vibrio sp. Isolate25]|uniref:hypothetical protein n=1 Tax=Vibrio sp. Isolate25 TaxID=2908535 RepID=UPI001EFE4E6E|nr:hypothetical protein [Vibrio sp. Isolate25]MCG9597289.1 hypothetical protein [Vibrio sp. Isolate25]